MLACCRLVSSARKYQTGSGIPPSLAKRPYCDFRAYLRRDYTLLPNESRPRKHSMILKGKMDLSQYLYYVLSWVFGSIIKPHRSKTGQYIKIKKVKGMFVCVIKW